MADERVWLSQEIDGTLRYFHCPAAAVEGWAETGWLPADEEPPEPVNPAIAHLVELRAQAAAAKAAPAAKPTKPSKPAAGADQGA